MSLLKAPGRALKRWLGRTIGGDISTPSARRAAVFHTHLVDHAYVRLWWKNLEEIAPDVWRMNQPAPKDIERLATMGVRTVLNLRGESNTSYWLLEDEAVRKAGMRMVNLRMSAKAPPPRQTLLDLIDAFDRAELPMVMHCKSGADRTGTAAAIWRLVKCGDRVEEAARQLSFRYLHVHFSKAGVQDEIFRAYAVEGEARGQSFRDWIAQDYDPDAIRASFARRRKRG